MRSSSMIKAALIVGSVLLAGCANGDVTPNAFSSSSTVWTGEGILVAQGEEMQLFKNAQTVGVYPNQCTTIAASSERTLTRFSKLHRRQVHVEGVGFRWPNDTTVSIKIAGNSIRNVCNSEIVVVANKIVANEPR